PAGGPGPAARRLTLVVSRPPALGGGAGDARTRAPVPRARLTLDDGAHTRTVRSGPDGRYEIRGLVPQRRYRLRADQPRYVPWVRGDILLATSETRPVDVPLRLAASISGRVVDEDGKPVAGALGRLVPGGA